MSGHASEPGWRAGGDGRGELRHITPAQFLEAVAAVLPLPPKVRTRMPVVWEGRHREVSPYHNHRRNLAIGRAPRQFDLPQVSARSASTAIVTAEPPGPFHSSTSRGSRLLSNRNTATSPRGVGYDQRRDRPEVDRVCPRGGTREGQGSGVARGIPEGIVSRAARLCRRTQRRVDGLPLEDIGAEFFTETGISRAQPWRIARQGIKRPRDARRPDSLNGSGAGLACPSWRRSLRRFWPRGHTAGRCC
jgi:hypothetical protein